SAPGDPRRNCEAGIEFKHTRCCLTCLRITSEMGESGRETAVSPRIGGILTNGLLPCDDGLVKATKLNQGLPHTNKHQKKPRVYQAHANGPFKAADRGLPCERFTSALAGRRASLGVGG